MVTEKKMELTAAADAKNVCAESKREKNPYEASVTELAGGKISGLASLYEAMKKPVFLLAYSILEDYSLAEDAMQETFLRVNAKAGTYQKDTNPKAWVFSVARSVALNMQKARGREKLCADPPDTTTTDSVENRAILDADFTRAVAVLDEKERGIIILKIGANLRHTEIAKILGITPGDARIRYFRALKKLKAYYRT